MSIVDLLFRNDEETSFIVVQDIIADEHGVTYKKFVSKVVELFLTWLFYLYNEHPSAAIRYPYNKKKETAGRERAKRGHHLPVPLEGVGHVVPEETGPVRAGVNLYNI